MATHELQGYLEFQNLEFTTCVPMFRKKGSASGYYIQNGAGEKIDFFERVPFRSNRLPENMVTLESAILRCVGDNAVFIQANLGKPIIVSGSMHEHVQEISNRLHSMAGDLVDPVVGLELACLTKDDSLIGIFFRRVARAAYEVSPHGARKWAAHHRLRFSHPDLVDGFLKGDWDVNAGGDLASSLGNSIAKFGFADAGLRYYCSAEALEFVELFDSDAVRDPILKHTRPITEFPSRVENKDVFLVTCRELVRSDNEAVSMAKAATKAVQSGASLVLVEFIDRSASARPIQTNQEVSLALTVLSENLPRQSEPTMQSGVSILRESALVLKRLMREQTPAEKLSESGVLLSAKLQW